jgi:hypothetical protein
MKTSYNHLLLIIFPVLQCWDMGTGETCDITHQRYPQSHRTGTGNDKRNANLGGVETSCWTFLIRCEKTTKMS